MAAIQQDEHWLNRLLREKLPTRTKKKIQAKSKQTTKVGEYDKFSAIFSLKTQGNLKFGPGDSQCKEKLKLWRFRNSITQAH